MTQAIDTPHTLFSIDRVDVREACKVGHEEEIIKQFDRARFLPLSECRHTFIVASLNSHNLCTFQDRGFSEIVVMGLDIRVVIVLYERTCYQW